MQPDPYRVLFLCTGNSARSVMAEVLLNELGAGRFSAMSAGSHPTGTVNAAAIRKLEDCGHDAGDVRSKSWHELAAIDAPQFDFIITVCDQAARETCPVWPGDSITAHWGIPDPAGVTGSDDAMRRAFSEAYDRLRERITQLIVLPLDSLSSAETAAAVRAIGDPRAQGAERLS